MLRTKLLLFDYNPIKIGIIKAKKKCAYTYTFHEASSRKHQANSF